MPAVVRGLQTPAAVTLILVGSRLHRRFLWQVCRRHQGIQHHPAPAFGVGNVDDAALAIHADTEPSNDPFQQRAGRSRCSRMPRPGCRLGRTLRQAYRRNLLADTDNLRRNPKFGIRRGPLHQVLKGSAHAKQADGTRGEWSSLGHNEACDQWSPGDCKRSSIHAEARSRYGFPAVLQTHAPLPLTLVNPTFRTPLPALGRPAA